MPKTLNPQNAFPTNIPNFPISGNNEPMTIEPLENAIQAVLNRSENLHVRLSEAETQGVKRVRKVASLAALSAVTGFNNGDVCDVEGYGRYRLYNPSGLTADGLWVLNAAGGGCWVHTLRDMRGIGNGLATLDSSQRLAQDVRDASILTQHIANQAVTAAKLAPGAVAGHLGYTPLNKAGDTMLGVLTIQTNFSQLLNLKGGTSDHAYMAFYARSADQNARSGYIGYPNSGSNQLTITNEIGENVVINNTLLSRYDHQNRFSISEHAPQTVNISPGGITDLATARIKVPAGRSLYIRRVRYKFLDPLRVRIGTSQTTWTASNADMDADVNFAIFAGSGTTDLSIVVTNVGSSNQTLFYAQGVWVELEIR